MLDPRFEADCEAVCRLIQPADTPPWLTEYFAYWATSLGSEWSIASLQPTRKEMSERLARIYEGADALDTALSDSTTVAFIERFHEIGLGEKVTGLRGSLQAIRDYAYTASKSPALLRETGQVKSGRGTTVVLGAIVPKTYCALIVAEAWKFVHGEYPLSKNVAAANAAMAFWSVSGGPPEAGWGEGRAGAWRRYFESALGPKFESRKAECLRILEAVKSIGLQAGI